MTELEVLQQLLGVNTQLQLQVADLQVQLASCLHNLSRLSQYQLILVGMVGILVMVVMLRD